MVATQAPLQAEETALGEVTLQGHAAWPLRESTAIAPIDAVDTVAAAVAAARDAAFETGIDIVYAYASAPVWVRTDQSELRHALDELLAGALRSASPGALAVRCTAVDGSALLEVREVPDPGATGADLDTAFAGSPTEHEDRRGRLRWPGLGQLRTLARTYQGDVGVTSSPETGSRITLRLPIA